MKKKNIYKSIFENEKNNKSCFKALKLLKHKKDKYL